MTIQFTEKQVKGILASEGLLEYEVNEKDDIRKSLVLSLMLISAKTFKFINTK
jgi:hypothetical protein